MYRALTFGMLVAISAGAMSPQSSAYLFSYFTGNGEDGLHLAHSRDGLIWRPLNGGKSFLRPSVGSRLMRDPSIVGGPDEAFHMVWTTGWWDRGIGIAHSKDLITWSEQRHIPVMAHEPTALNCWAPEIFYDEATARYLIFWATSIPGRFPETEASGDEGKRGRTNHRIYFVATKDFESYSPTKLLFDDGFSVIDAAIAKSETGYVMIVKDETKNPVAKKHLRIATAERADGPYGHASPPISPDWVEGPSPLRVGADWLIYYDEYTRHHYGAIRSRDLKQWEIVTPLVSFPGDARHGTAFAAPEAIVARLLAR